MASGSEDAAAPVSNGAAAAYPGTGFIVHEWGTNTVVVGSDGVLLRGMHHEEEDLPAFVYDRLRQGQLLAFPSVDKMETPVDYFYSDRPLTVTVSVGMPRGVLTQWYPAVQAFAPPILMGAPDRIEAVDPVLDLGFPFRSQQCIDKYTPFRGGKLDWGQVEILARDATLDPAPPPAPLERFTWAYARDVAANPIRARNPSHREGDLVVGPITSGPQTERFLFYRGLGNFELPVAIAAAGDAVKLANQSEWQARGPVFVLQVGKETGAFHVSDGALAPGDETIVARPRESETLPIDGFVEALDEAMTAALLGTGLYRDEAVAMVRTWRRQWFRTPGLRVLHFAPNAWIDREVPLTISPTPTTTVRVMVLRIELLDPAVEAEDRMFAAQLDGGSNQASAEQHFRALGRFAEPRLRRALATLGATPSGAARFLAAIERPNASFAVGP